MSLVHQTGLVAETHAQLLSDASAAIQTASEASMFVGLVIGAAIALACRALLDAATHHRRDA